MVPLTDEAIPEFKALIELSGDSPFVMCKQDRSQSIHPMLITRSVARLLERFHSVGIAAFTPHDLRRTGLAALGIDDYIAERVLNHKLKDMQKVYNKYKYLKEKRIALETWEKHLVALLETARREAAAAATQSRVSVHALRRSRKPKPE